MSQKFVITGGAGFIGSHLAEALAIENDVTIIDDLSMGKLKNIAGLAVEFRRGCITDLKLLKHAFQGADCVFHLAAIASVKKSFDDPLNTNNVGIEGTLKVLLSARDTGVRRVVIASSAAVYGNSLQLPKREDMIPEPISPYAISKLAGEQYAKVFHETYGLQTVSLRYFNVFGPRQDPSSQYSGVISRFISAIQAGEKPAIYGDGEQTRDFIYVKDVVRANLFFSHTGIGIFNIASGKGTSLNKLISVIAELYNKDIKPRYEAPRLGDIKDSIADINRAKYLGYSPEYSLEKGLEETIAQQFLI